MTGFVYDTGALIAAENNDRRIWDIHKRALERRAAPIVPAGVLTEAWRGKSPPLARFLAGAQMEQLNADAARAAGGLLANTGDREVEAVDAMVVEVALRYDRAVLTSNYSDIKALADSANRALDIVSI